MPDPTDKNKPKKYQQPGVVSLTDEEVKGEDIPKQEDLDALDAWSRRAKQRNLFKQQKKIRFDSNIDIDEEFVKDFNSNSSFIHQRTFSKNKEEAKDTYSILPPVVKDNMDEESKNSLVQKKQELETLKAKTFYGGALLATKAFKKAKQEGKIPGLKNIAEDSELRTNYKNLEWWRYPANLIKDAFLFSYDAVVNLTDMGTGMMISAVMPGLTEEEEARKEKLENEIYEIEKKYIKQDYKILKSQFEKEKIRNEALLRGISEEQIKNESAMSKFHSSNENVSFTDAFLVGQIEDLRERTLEEYESWENKEGWWGGLTEDAPDIFNTLEYIALWRLAKEDPEQLTDIQKNFIEASEKYKEVKGLNLNSNEAYRFFRDSFRPSADFMGEIFLTRGIGKALGTSGVVAKTGLKGTSKAVAETVMNSALMPQTLRESFKGASSNLQVVRGLDGEEQVFTTDKSKESFILKVKKEKDKIDYEIYKLQSQTEPLTKQQEKLLEYYKLLNSAYTQSINQVIDKKGNLRKPETNLASEFGKSFYETGKDLFAERFIGAKVDQVLPNFGNITLMGMANKFKNPIRKAGDVITKTKAGKITKNLLGHKGVGKYIQSMPAEMVEEVAVQLMPSFDVNYADQISEFANPDFYLHIAGSVFLMNSATGAGGAAFQKVQMFRDPEYAKEVKTQNQRLKELRRYIRALDESMTDEALAKEVAMVTLDSKFLDIDLDATIANLRNPDKNVKGEDQKERNRKADLLEENKFINAAIFAVQSGTDNELTRALKNILKRGKLSNNKKKAVAKALGMVGDLKRAYRQNEGLFDGDKITEETVNVILNSKLLSDLEDNKNTIDLELENLEAEFIEQSNKYDARPEELMDKSTLSSGDFSDATQDYILAFNDFLDKKGKDYIGLRRMQLEQISNMLKERVDEINKSIKKKKSTEYQEKRKADKAKAASIKEEFDAYKDVLPKKEREEREELYKSKNPKKAVQDYNKKKDFKEEHTKTADTDDKAFSDVINPKPKKTKSKSKKEVTQPVDIESKKAEINRRRKKEIDSYIKDAVEKEDKEALDSIYKGNIGDEIRIGVYTFTKTGENEWSSSDDVGEFKKTNQELGDIYFDLNYDKESDKKVVFETLEAYLNTGNITQLNKLENEEGNQISKINAKYDAELAALEKEESQESQEESIPDMPSSEEMEAGTKREEDLEDDEILSPRSVEPSDDNMSKTEILYNKIKGDSKKSNPGVQEIVNYMVKVHGWDYVAKRYKNIMTAFRHIGVDVTDAQDIYAKYDDVDNMFDDVVDEDIVEDTPAEIPNPEEVERKVEEKQEKQVKKKNTIVIDGEEFQDNRSDSTNTKFSITSVERRRINDTTYIDGDELIMRAPINNHYMLDIDYVKNVEKVSKEKPGSLSLRLFDLNDEIVYKNVRSENFKMNLDVELENRTQQNWKLPTIELKPGEALTVGGLRQKIKEAGFDKEVEDEFIAMYAPMIYKFEEDNLGYAHILYWYSDEAKSLNDDMSQEDREIARENTRQLRRSVFYSDNGIMPVIIKGIGSFPLNGMNDEQGNIVRKKVSEAVGKVQGYDDPIIGKIGQLRKTKKGIMVTFNNAPDISLDKISDDIRGGDMYKEINENKNYYHVQIFPSHVEGKPYRLNYINDENQQGYSKIAKDSYFKVLLADTYLDKNTKPLVKEHLESIGLTTDKAQKIIKAAGNLKVFYDAIGVKEVDDIITTGSKEVKNFKAFINNAETQEKLTNNVLPDIYNIYLGQQFQTHYLRDTKIFNIPVFRENNFEFEKLSYQEFLQEIYTSKNRAYTIKTKDGKDKTIFTINPQIYTDPYIEEESDVPESSMVTNQDIKNYDEEETDIDTRTAREKLRDSLKEKGYDDDYINNVLDRFKQDDELGSSRKVSQEQEKYLNSIENDRIEDITADQERIVGQHIVHNVALTISKGDFTDLGNKIIKIVDDNIDRLLKERTEIYEIIKETGADKYLETSRQHKELMEAVSKDRTKIYNKVIRSFNDTIDAELEEVADDTDMQQWAKELEDRHVSTRLSQKIKMAFYGIPKKSVKSATVIQPYGLTEYHRPIEIFNKLKDIFTEIDPSWDALINELKKKKKKFEYPIYNDIINRLQTLDDRLKNSMVFEMTGYKAVYYKGDIKRADEDYHHVNILDINDTKKTITIINNLKNNFKNIYGEPKGKEIYLNKTLVKSLLKDIDNVKTMSLEETKKFFDTMGFIEINENTWHHLSSKEEEQAAFDSFIEITKEKLTDLNKISSDTPLKVKDNIFEDMAGQLNRLVILESELNHSIVGSTKRDGDKNVPSTIPPMMVYDEARKFVQSENIKTNSTIPFIAEGYIHKLLVQDKLSDVLKKQLEKLALPSLEVLKLNNKVVGSDPAYTKQGEFEHFVYQAMLYTNTMNDLSELKNLGLADYPSLKFKPRKLTGLTPADKKRTYIQTIPTLDLTQGFIEVNNTIEYTEDMENFLLDNLFMTQLKSIIKNYKNDEINNYTSKDFNKAFYHLLALNTIEINGMNIHDYLAKNYKNLTEQDIKALREKALPIIKDEIKAEVKSKMKKFPEGYYFVDRDSLKKYQGETIKDKYKRFLVEFSINNTLGNMFSFQAYAGNFYHYGTIDVNSVKDKSNIREWSKLYDKFEAKVHKRTAMLIAPGNVFAESKGKKIAHIALNEVFKTSDQIVELIEQSYKAEDMTDKQVSKLNTLKNLVTKNKKLKNQKTLTVEDRVLIKEYENKIANLKNYFQDVEGYFELQSTDAQMYVTYKGYLDMLVKEGKINDKQRNNFITKIENEEQLSEEDKKELGLINLQPKKLVYNAINYNSALQDNVPVYIKNSTFPLFPGLTKGRQLDKLRQGMEKVERETGLPTFASYPSANKVGHKATQITMDDIYYSEGSIPFLETGYTELDYAGLRLQQATPSKEQKAFQEMQDAKQTLGSQMSKILMGDGINRIKDKVFPNLFQTVDNKDDIKTLKIDNKTYTISEKISSKELAKRNELTIASNIPVYIVNETLGTRKGGYSRSKDIIILSKDTDKETIYHELIHSVEQKLDKKRVEPLYKKVKNSITENSFDGFVTWNFKKNISEFIADSLSKKVFRDALKKEGLLEEVDNVLNIYTQETISELPLSNYNMLSGPELDRIYFDLYEKYNNYHKNKLEKELGVQNMSDFYQLDVAGQRKVIVKLRDILKNEVKKRNYPQALLDNLNNIVENERMVSFESPFIFDSNSYKFEALLQAVIANRVIIHKLPGNSHIVGTSEGFKRLKVRGDDTLTDTEKSKMIFLNSEVANNGLKSNVLENRKLQRAQVFIKPHFKYVNSEGEMVYVDMINDTKIDKDGNTVPKYWYIDEDGNKIINTDMIDDELMSQFSFRIPTSSHQSGALLEVAGFLPPDSQDLLIVPAEHTEQLGEDYDVDARKVYKENYWVNSEGKIKLIRPENVDEIAEQNVENLNMYISQKEKMDILKEELGITTKEWKSYTDDIGIPRDMIYSDDKFEYEDLWKSAFGDDIDKRNRFLAAALDAKDDQIELATKVNQAMSNMDFVRQRGIEIIKKNLEFKLLENDLINVYKSVYSSNDKRVQNKINKSLSTDVMDASADVVYDKLRESSGQRQSDILSNETQFRLMKGGADGSVTIGISSKGVVAEAQAQRINGVELKTIEETRKRVKVSSRPVQLGGYRVEKAIIGGKDLKTLDNKRNNKRDKSAVHMELQNVNLDNINKGIMAKTNMNVHTMPMFVMSAHLGFNGTKEPITLLDRKTKKHLLLSVLLSSQPIIYEYVKEKEKSNLTEEYSDDKDLEIINNLLDRYGAGRIEKKSDLENSSFLSESYTEQGMYETIGMPFENMSREDKLTQLELLRTFIQLTDMATQWTDVQNSYNFSTSKLGVSYFETLDKIDKLDEIADRHFQAVVGGGTESENTVSLIGEVSSESREGFTRIGNYYWKPTTIEGLQAINSLAIAQKVMPIFYPYQKEIFQTIMSKAKLVKGKDAKLTLKEKYDLMYEFTSAINALAPTYKIYDDNVDDVIKRIFIDSKDNTSLGTYLETLKAMGHPIMQNPFMEDLSFDNKRNRNVKRIVHTTNNDSGITPEEKTSAFLSLLENLEVIKDKDGEPILFNSEEVTYRDIALDLVTYQMLSDDKKGAISFKNVIPFDLLQGAGVTSYYRQKFDQVLNNFIVDGEDVTENVAENFIRQYYQHNPKKAKFVKELPKEGSYQNLFVVMYQGSTPKLYEFTEEKYKPVEILDGFDTFKQYDIRKSKKSDLMTKIRNGRKKQLDTRTKRKSLTSVQKLDRRLKFNDDGTPKNLQELLESLIGGRNISEQHKIALEVVKEQLSEDIKLEWLPSSQIKGNRLGSYNPRTNTIKLANNMFSLIEQNFGKEADTLAKMKEIMREVSIEEMVHAVTVKELRKHLSSDGTPLSDDPPVFAMMLSDMFTTAKKALNQEDSTNKYYTSNIDEFVGGMFASKKLHENLEKELPGFVQRFKRFMRNLFNYLLGKGNVTQAYKDEFFKAIDDMFKFRDNQDTQLPDIYVDRNINQFKDQRIKLKKKIKTQKPSGNESQVYNENSIFGDTITQDMIDNIIANEVTKEGKDC